MKEILSARDIDFYVAIIPVFNPDQIGFSDYKYAKIHDEIVDVLAQDNIHVFDLLEVFKTKNILQTKYAIDLWHPNEEGHKIIAEALVRLVLME